ncbi:MAG TPA: MFS transporter [Pseudonocardiaceae bacterium]|jgi:EmrB/QacA subfamily drug resistance transporter|nr:MFS transporter [Pseudonocardiaceae bacterium]
MQTHSQEGRGRWVLPVLSVAAFMASLDLFIVNVAFANIGRSFGGSPLSDLSWILNAYAILYAALLVPLGRLADRFGQKAGFLLGLGLFVVGSAACAISPGLWSLVIFRAVQAIGAAALTPTSLGLLITATAPARRARAVRIWAATGGLAAAAGPVAGGLLVEASWRWVFLVNVPIGIAALIIAAITVPGTRHDRSATVPDLAGVGLLVVAIGVLALGLVKAPDWGWDSPKVIACLVVAILATAVFWRRSLHHPAPVVEPTLLRVRTFAWSNVASLLFTVAFAGGLLANILWLQDVWHYSALRTGIATVPGPLMVPLFAALSQRVAHRIPASWIAAAGCVVVAVAQVFIIFGLGPTPAYFTEALPGWLLIGIGVGLALPTMLSTATHDLPPARSATGSAVVNMSRQIGTVLGVSLLVAILGVTVGYPATHAAYVDARWVLAGAALLGAVTAMGMTSRRLRTEIPSVATETPAVELA